MSVFEENLGRNTYVSLSDIKNYLQITSNTHDAQLQSSIDYATGVVEHYIGYEIKANTYTEYFDGNTPSIYTSRVPLSNVYSVSEFDGTKYRPLRDPDVEGLPNYSESDNITFDLQGTAATTSKTKKYGDYSLRLESGSFARHVGVPEHLRLEDENFTIEGYVRVDSSYLQDGTFFSIETDTNNKIELKVANAYALAYTATIDGTAFTVRGSNAYVERSQFKKRQWAHVAFTRDMDNDRFYVHYNGNLIANAEYSESNLTFTSNIVLGSSFTGYVDDFRISNDSRYCNTNFTPPNRHVPDEYTVMLLHFDEPNEVSSISDSHASDSDYVYTSDIGKIEINNGAINRASIFGSPKFKSYANAVKVEYKAGYTVVPIDLKLATMDLAKILYKQDQEKQRFSFEGESGDKFTLSSNFPPHIRRVLDLYRLID